MLAPVRSNLRIDHTRALIPDLCRIPVAADGTEHSLPDVPLLARASMRTENQLPPIGAFGSGQNDAGRRAHLRLRDATEGTDRPIRIFIFVDVHRLIRMKIHGIRARAPS